MPYWQTRSAEIASVAALHRNDTFLLNEFPSELKYIPTPHIMGHQACISAGFLIRYAVNVQ
jgi:hypothetical protein